MVYKVLNGTAPNYTAGYFTPVSETHSHNTRSSAEGALVIDSMKTNCGARTFKCDGARLWNKLAPAVRNPATYKIFKARSKQGARKQGF